MMSPVDTRIAFIGGANNPAALDAVIALHNAGYEVIVGDHDPRESVALRDANIPFSVGRAEAVEQVQVVITSLESPEKVEDVYLGSNGLLELMKPGSYALDLSFIPPKLAREIQAMGAVSDIYVVDAPLVNYGDHEEPTLFVGGEQQVQSDLSPLFPYLAKNVMPQEGAGQGQFAAVLATIALAGSLMGAIEALSVARVSGFSQKAAVSLIAETAGASRAFVDYTPQVLEHDFSGTIHVSTFLNALSVALSVAEELDITMPLTETAFQLYELLSTVGGDDLNLQALSLLYEDEKTCADYGLDWALADNYASQAGVDGVDLDELFGDDGDDEDGEPDDGQQDGPDMPPIGGFFSRN
ncbi:MAG: NAD(P)-dependent oxidoreductase [Coriobacteriales bacterium]|jgi:3-hydroxyisobutyrate dehydrogenase